MKLDEARGADQVTDEDVRLAEAEAAEVAELARELDRRAIEDPKPPKPGEVIEQRALASFAARRAQRTRMLADKAKSANRLLALDQVGQDVIALAAEAGKPKAGIIAAVSTLATAAAALQEICRQHDDKVRSLIDRATALDVEPAAPHGPRATSAHVALASRRSHGTAGIAAGRTAVRFVGQNVADALQLAIKGDADGALARIAAVHQQPLPRRADRYYRSPSGIVSQSGPESTEFAQQVRKRIMTRMSDDEVDRYLDGRLDSDG